MKKDDKFEKLEVNAATTVFRNRHKVTSNKTNVAFSNYKQKLLVLAATSIYY